MISWMRHIFEINLGNIINSKFIKFASVSLACYSFYEIPYEILLILKDIHDENLSLRLIMLCVWIQVLLGTAPIFLSGEHLNKITKLIKYDFKNTPYKQNHGKITWIKKRNSYYSLFLIVVTGIWALSLFPWQRKNDQGYMHMMKNFPGKIFEWLPYNYYLGWIFYVGVSFMAGLFMACYTHLLIYFETVISSEVIILNENLRDISRGYEYLDIVTMPKNPWYQKMINKRLRHCMMRHSKILRFLSEINKFFYYWLPLYSASSLNFCIFALYLGFKDMTAQIESKIVYVLSIAQSVIIFTTIGQHMMDRVVMMSVETALYQTPWYCWNTPNRKTMWLFLMNTQKKCTLSINGIFDINFNLLIWIFKTIYSSIMLLRQLKV